MADQFEQEALLLDGLATRAAAGDRPAFGQIYSHLSNELHAYLRSQCHDDGAVEDLLANVFLKAWRSIHTYRAGSLHFRRWVYGIARNEVRDHWRTADRTVPLPVFDLAEDPAVVSELDPEDVRRMIAGAMATLTPDQRQVVLLRYFGEKSHEEIAAIMGKGEGAVRALLLRALRRMRRTMAHSPETARASRGAS
jgi:RNA polymerase sigma-70 factor, ECF subfamily